MKEQDRHSEAQEVELITDPVKLAEAEWHNVVKQYRKIDGYILDSDGHFKLCL